MPKMTKSFKEMDVEMLRGRALELPWDKSETCGKPEADNGVPACPPRRICISEGTEKRPCGTLEDGNTQGYKTSGLRLVLV